MQMMLKKILSILLLFFHFSSFSQASGSADFEITVKFADNIPVSALQVSYFKKSGNRFEKIHYRVNDAANEMIIFGRNHYILWVPFPTLVFSFVQYETGDEGKINEYTTEFYLGTNGCLSSYNQPLKGVLQFSMENLNLVVVQENRLEVPVVKKAELFPGNKPESVAISNQSVRIFARDN